MYAHYTNNRAVADALKALADRIPKPSDRRAAFQAVARFERCGWQPQAFKMAAEGVLTPTFNGDVLRFSASLATADAIPQVIRRYIEIVECNQRQIYSTQQAADYLEMPLRTLKLYIHEYKWLKPANEGGHDLMFTRPQLDEFREAHPRRGPGRPWPKSEEA